MLFEVKFPERKVNFATLNPITGEQPAEICLQFGFVNSHKTFTRSWKFHCIANSINLNIIFHPLPSNHNNLLGQTTFIPSREMRTFANKYI